MLSPEKFYNILKNNSIEFFTGVPDSLLKDFCAYITDHTPKEKNIIAANEGNAIALAAGYYLATGQSGLVYMQNSGLGNTVNPLVSLADPDVYSIPMLLMIGWRGEPGIKDEPQHKKQGKITLDLLEAMGIAYEILPDNLEEAQEVINSAIMYMSNMKAPYAIVIRKNTFEPYKLKNITVNDYALTREDAIKTLISVIAPQDVIVSTTGMASRELFEYREERKEGHEKDFLTVGSMGHASQIALAIALAKPERKVYCLDGDGALIMHMGSMAITGNLCPQNMRHIIINNGAHDSVGGQPTAGLSIDIGSIAKACGYKMVLEAQTKEEIIEGLEKLNESNALGVLEIKVRKGARKDLGRPTTTPIENKEAFMKFLSE
ncbi:phosphonopyruvate decarboxylase [Defluviitalea raffinosedens]|uniref:Phosphonopyruvate decarboxylase n=1 Tax=Defluviitalea raffinosedens TaxID=1450156 RepID=A0A7C8LJT0_9FIRM|nr:phosphonopyruvate decarboxylase [Defluviitalea raffinosedens]KAE9634980.1 phosphonopyruvate decarboxylase [Defluviitalea raffinosedens]